MLPKRNQGIGQLTNTMLGPSHYFDASGRVEKPEGFGGKFYEGQALRLGYAPDGKVPSPYQAVTMPQAQQPQQTQQQTQPATTQSVQQQAGAAMPQSLGANALMGAGQQMQEKRQAMMPLQGYQNALLRGF